MTNYKFLAFANLLFCIPIMLICILQLRSTAARRFIAVWGVYTLALVAAVASGFQPVLWGEWPTPATVLFSASAAAMIAMAVYKMEWRFK